MEHFSALNKDKPFNYTTGLALIHQLDTNGKNFRWTLTIPDTKTILINITILF